MNPLRCLRAFSLFAFLLAAPAFAALDVMENGGHGDGVSDVWQLKYNAPNLNPTADPDGDGVSNAQEAGAGTDPFAPNDTIEVRNLQVSGNSLTMQWPSVLGKRYKVQSTTSLNDPASWVNLNADYLEGTGAEMSHTVTITGVDDAGTFYRVAVYDKDTDGDGVTDWEELQMGLDPENDHSHGVGGPSDLAWLTQGLTAQNVVTVTASEPSEPENAFYPASFIVRRTGGLVPITVTYTVSGGATPGVDYTALSGTVTLPLGANFATITLTPIADAIPESSEAVIVTIQPGDGYVVGQPAAAGILLEDATGPTGTGLNAQYWSEGATVLNQNTQPAFAGTPQVQRVDANINFNWASGEAPDPTKPAGFTDGYWSSRWTGEILPAYSQIYTFSIDSNFAGRVIINGQKIVDNWPAKTVVKGNSADPQCRGIIELAAGRRYPIIVEHYQDAGTGRAILRWQSANEFALSGTTHVDAVVPQNRLFPNAAPQIYSGLESYAFVGTGAPAYSYQILASANPTSYEAANLPPGLVVNTTTGVISGTPAGPGVWQVVITAKNALGSGSAILALNVLQNGGGLTREVWNGVAGTTVSTIPLALPPSATSTILSFEGPQNAGDNYGARIRGYITAPATGPYQFFLRADQAAELYISNDDEAAGVWKRAEVTAPTAATGWDTAARSELLYLKAGFRYYVEVRHKEGTGDDYLAVGWSRPGEPTTTASEIVPGYLLTQYVAAAPVAGDSTLYTAKLTPQGGANTAGYGNATLQVSADRTEAVLHFEYGNLTGVVAQKHIHSGADGGLILFDLDSVSPGPDGNYTWHIGAVSGVADKDGDGDSDADDVRRLIEDGSAYLNLHTALYPAGEIKGFFLLAAGTQEFIAPAPALAWTDDHGTRAAASRFLQQATFGPTPADITALQAMPSYSAWIDDQFTKAPTLILPEVLARRNVIDPDGTQFSSNLTHSAWWRAAVAGEDQLRQRVAFALSEILVTSTDGPLEDNARATADYYDTLVAGHRNADGTPTDIPGFGTLNAGAFGNFRDILIATTLHPAMGRYLDMLRNDRPNRAIGRSPNENYAREVLQLFSIGLNRLHPDGSLMLNSKGLPIPTYDQDAIVGFAHAFTGWDYGYTGALKTNMNAAANWVDPMREVPAHHYTGQKRVLNNVVLPGLYSLTNNGTTYPVDPDFDYSVTAGATVRNDDEFTALAAQEIVATHEQVFRHPNVGPFICRQLIQRLVTSTPSRGYIYRVTSKFNDNGSGVRGDMRAVIKAILLDYEARSATAAASPGYGKQREPILRVTQVARAFVPTVQVSGPYTQDGGVITINSAPTQHRLANSQKITLAFDGIPTTSSGTYTVSNFGGAVPITATQFGVTPMDCVRGNFTQSASTTLTVTALSAHGLSTGQQVYLRIRAGATGTPPASGLYPVTVTSGTVFTIAVATGTSAGTCDVSFMRGGYNMPPPATGETTSTVTLTTATAHGLTTGANVYLDFTAEGVGIEPPAQIYPITVVDDTTFTVTATYPTGTTATLANTFFGAAAAPALDRSGTATTGFSDYTMNNTDTDLMQTPLRSPTVFNFFMPDYQSSVVIEAARAVSSANTTTLTPGFQLTTPEFQITSETNVIRQANFFQQAVFGANTGTGGLSGFKNGAGDLGFDLGPWMGLRPGGTGYWTDNNTASPSNDNLRNLIRELSTVLMAGQMSTAMENSIYTWVSNNTTTGGNPLGNLAYTTAAPTETQRRDRVRAVVHLIITSPEFTIQK